MHDRAARFIERRQRTIEVFTRVGWLAKGLVYLLFGVTAVAIARQSAPSDEASPQGALGEVMAAPAGRPMLGLVAVGLLLYAIWSAASVVLVDGSDLAAWGDIGAATALYGGPFIVVVMHARSRRIRLAAGTLAALVICSVTLSRFSLGMHYPSDALGRLASGLIALLTFRWAVHRTLAGSALPGRPAVDCPARNSASPESEQSNSSTRRETQHVG